MTNQAAAVVNEFAELGGDPLEWLARMRASRTDPHLHAAHGAQMAAIERSLAEAIAQRLGTTLERDPYPGLLASIATGVFRSSMSFWASSGGTVPLEHLVDQAFAALASGLPEPPTNVTEERKTPDGLGIRHPRGRKRRRGRQARATACCPTSTTAASC